MKILILSTEFPPGPGGIGTHAYQLARGLQERGWHVMVLTPQDNASENEIRGFNYRQPFKIKRHLRFWGTVLDGLSRFFELWRYIVSWKPEMMLVSGSRAVWITAVLTRIYKLPWVVIAHGGIEFGTPIKWVRNLTRWAYSQPDLVVSVSQYSQELMLKLGVCPPKTAVIPNGADGETFFPLKNGSDLALRKEYGLENAHILLTVGSVSERKGQEVVIRALPEILTMCPNVHYWMVGLPKIKSQLMALAEQLGVQSHVHFLGRVDHQTLLAALNASDLFVMTSRFSADGDSEGYGIAVVEAALCAKPAVVSGGSGLAEAIVDGKTGLIVPVDDIDATAYAILKLLQDNTLRSQMAQQAYDRAISEQLWSHRIDAYSCVLNDIYQATVKKNG